MNLACGAQQKNIDMNLSAAIFIRYMYLLQWYQFHSRLQNERLYMYRELYLTRYNYRTRTQP